MKAIVFAMVAGAGMLLVTSLEVSAMPADGAVIARIGQQVDSVINTKTKKEAQTRAKPACPADQERSNRTGNCRPLKSQN